MKLADHLTPASIQLDLEGRTKEQVLRELVALAARTGKFKDPGKLLDVLLERESLGSTGIGHGVAIPHGRSPELDESVVVFGRTRTDVDFDSIDGQPTRLLFLLVAPEDGTNEHLHLLSRIARLMRDADTRLGLLDAATPEAALALILAKDMK
jgi:fructose-specific phosphotransferase system IIA component